MEDVPFPKQSTPFPNFLLDRWLPLLKDTEFRVLCIVVRQTLGWVGSKPGTRRCRDWLSQTQLMRRTGRSSEAVSGAIKRLVYMGLIEVSDISGNRLFRPASRQMYQGKMYFKLGPTATGVADQLDLSDWRQ
jgi:hypothetical protein